MKQNQTSKGENNKISYAILNSQGTPISKQIIPLLPNEACNLGSINLKLMVKEENGKRVINWNRLQVTTRLAVRFLDNVIDANEFPLLAIEEMVKGNRKIGLGVMGFADALAAMKIPYASKEGVLTAGIIMGFIQTAAWKES